jgi:hypothetical protein
MYAQSLGLTLATTTVRSDSEVVDVASIFSDEVEAAINFAAATGYSQLDLMIDEAHSIRLVRLHLAQARWEHEEDVQAAQQAAETAVYPLQFKPATRRVLN